MAKVIILSKRFPSYHIRCGEDTDFINKTLSGFKKHTIRAGKRWKEGDKASLRYWTGKPYRSPQGNVKEVTICKVWDIEISSGSIKIEGNLKDGIKTRWENFVGFPFEGLSILAWEIAKNDGLTLKDFTSWFLHSPSFKKGGSFSGQIICWDPSVKY